MIFDAHGDILTDMYQEHLKNKMLDSFKKRHLKKYLEADIKASIFVNYTNPEYGNKQIFKDIFKEGFKEISANQDILEICLNYQSLIKAIDNKKIGVIIGVEGIKYLENDEELVELYDLGLRHIALTWNEVNEYGTGILGGETGITEKGKLVLKKAEALGMIIDLAHANNRTFFDVLANTKKSIIVSHANCKALCNHPRNLSDEQLLAIKSRNGVVGLTNVANFISTNAENQNVLYLAKHIDYACKLIGVDHVGLGLDICYYLDENQKNTRVIGFEDINLINNLIGELRNIGYSEIDILKISYQNFFRVIKEILN